MARTQTETQRGRRPVHRRRRLVMVTLPPEVHERLKRAATATGSNVSRLVERLAVEGLDRPATWESAK